MRSNKSFKLFIFSKKDKLFYTEESNFFSLVSFSRIYIKFSRKKIFQVFLYYIRGRGDVSNLEVIENIFKDFASFYTDLLIALYLRTKHSDWGFMLANGDYWLSHKNKTNESWTTEFFNKFIFPKVVFRLLSGSD